MKNIFKRLMNFLLILFTFIGIIILSKGFDKNFILEKVLIAWSIGMGIFFGVMGGLNYVFFGKFTLWNKKDETE